MTVPDAPAMPAPASTGMAPVNGIQMYYATYGAGSPVLLIHGGLGHADLWASQVAEDAVFGAYIGRMAADFARLSPTPDQFDAFVAQISEMWATQPNWADADVAKIAVPTTVVPGEHDEAITRAHTDRITGLIPGATKVILPGVSHFAMLQDPAGYTAAIRAAMP